MTKEFRLPGWGWRKNTTGKEYFWGFGLGAKSSSRAHACSYSKWWLRRKLFESLWGLNQVDLRKSESLKVLRDPEFCIWKGPPAQRSPRRGFIPQWYLETDMIWILEFSCTWSNYEEADASSKIFKCMAYPHFTYDIVLCILWPLAIGNMSSCIVYCSKSVSTCSAVGRWPWCVMWKV